MDNQKRKKAAVVAGTLAVLAAAGVFKRRRHWRHPVLEQRKEESLYFKLVKQLRQQRKDHFYKYHRMTPDVFDLLLSIVRERLSKRSIREPISPEERLSMTLKHLAHGDDFETLAWQYRVGVSTAHAIVYDACDAIWDDLQPRYLPPPTKDTWLLNARRFDQLWHFPHAVGSVDGKHIVIQQPVGGGSDFYNYKHTHSIVLLAVADADRRFVIADIGVNGRICDAGVLNRSDFGKALSNGTLELPAASKLPESEVEAPYVFLGDEAFQLTQNFMIPYSARNLETEDHQTFNYRLSRGRHTVETTFGILATRWRILRRPIIVRNPAFAESIVKATVCLHNFLMSDDVREANLCEAHPKSRRACIPYDDEHKITTGGLLPIPNIGSNNYSKNAAAVRSLFATYFMNEGAVSWQRRIVRRGLD